MPILTQVAISDDLPQLLGHAPLNFEDVVKAQYAK